MSSVILQTALLVYTEIKINTANNEIIEMRLLSIVKDSTNNLQMTLHKLAFEVGNNTLGNNRCRLY